jgi:hypothetical protein
MLSCTTIPTKTVVDYDRINDIAYLKCIGTRIERLQSKGYKPTKMGYRNIQAFCYYHLKSAGVLR